MIYGRLDRYFEKMMPLLAASGATTTGNRPVYQSIHAFCGAFRFDGGKVRDVLFLEMPQLVDAGALTRSSLALGTKETFLYLASFLNLPNQMTWPSGGPAGQGVLGMAQKFVDAVAGNGATIQEWNAAFGPEIGVLADWANGAQWPGLLATVPVKDEAKANQLFTKITTSPDGTSLAQERDGVRYFTARDQGTPFSIAPSIALAGKRLIAGTSESQVEAAVHRSTSGSSELETSDSFRAAERLVPAGKQAFVYVDTALFYTRLEAAVRPLLVMSATLLPSVNENIDMSKFPPTEAITRHLSPIVMSQNYQSDGYVTESVGPVTFYEAFAGAALLGGGAAMLYERQARSAGVLGSLIPSLSSSPSGGSAAPSPSPSPTGTP
jgi:hypothetical protein